MELLGIAEITRVKRHLDISNVVDVLLGIHSKLFDVKFLCTNDTGDIVNETLPFRVLISNYPLHKVRESGLIFLVFDHGQPA